MGNEMPKFKEGQLIVYRNGDTYEIGKIKAHVSNAMPMEEAPDGTD